MLYFHKHKFSTRRLKGPGVTYKHMYTQRDTKIDKSELYVINGMGLGKLQQFLLGFKMWKHWTGTQRNFKYIIKIHWVEMSCNYSRMICYDWKHMWGVWAPEGCVAATQALKMRVCCLPGTQSMDSETHSGHKQGRLHAQGETGGAYHVVQADAPTFK